MILYLHPKGKEDLLNDLATQANLYLKRMAIGEIENLNAFVMYSQGHFINSNFCIFYALPAEMDVARKADFVRAVQTFKCMYSARLILILPELDKDSELMSKIMAEGIRNLIICGDEAQIVEECRVSLSDEGKEFQDTAHLIAQERVNLAREILKPSVPIPDSPLIVHVGGVMNRIGTTTQCFTVYRYLEWLGFRCGYVDLHGTHVQSMAALYQEEPQNGFLRVADLDLFERNPPESDYNALIFDFGVLTETNLEHFQNTEMMLLCCGSKAWELPSLAGLLVQEERLADAKMVFSFTAESQREGAAQMLAQMTNQVYFAPYTPDITGKSPDTEFYNSMLLDYLQGRG